MDDNGNAKRKTTGEPSVRLIGLARKIFAVDACFPLLGSKTTVVFEKGDRE